MIKSVNVIESGGLSSNACHDRIFKQSIFDTTTLKKNQQNYMQQIQHNEPKKGTR